MNPEGKKGLLYFCLVFSENSFSIILVVLNEYIITFYYYSLLVDIHLQLISIGRYCLYNRTLFYGRSAHYFYKINITSVYDISL